MKSLADLDDWLLLAVNYPAGRSPLFDKIVFDLADSTVLKGGLFLAFYWWLWFRDDARGERVRGPDDRRAVVVALIGGTIAAVVSRLLQVGLPFHQRPLHTPSLPLRLPVGVDAEMLNTFSSFPSDHAVLFFALCVPIWTLSRWLGAAAGLWTLFVICLPRVYLGYHYPSDVLAGAVAGILLMLVLRGVLVRTALPDRIVRLEASRRGLFYAAAFLLTLELAVLFYDVRHFGLDLFRMARALIG